MLSKAESLAKSKAETKALLDRLGFKKAAPKSRGILRMNWAEQPMLEKPLSVFAIPIKGNTSILETAQREAPEVREEIIAKSHRIAPLYNKGGLQYIGDNEDLTTLGKKV